MRLGLIAAFMVIVSFAGPEAAFASKILITIDKSDQQMTVSVDGEEKYEWPVSTGAGGYDTPSGSYRPFRMERDHFSEEWDDAPMPHSIFFTPEGHAIHGSPYTKRLGTPASHGCVRLAPPNAAKLFALVQKQGMKNTTVVVTGGGFGFGFFDSTDSRGRTPKWFKRAKPTPTVFKSIFN